MKTKTLSVDAAIDVLAEQHARHEAERMRERLRGMLNGAMATKSPYSIPTFANEAPDGHSADALRYATGPEGLNRKRKYVRSAATRAKMAASQRARWAKPARKARK